MSFKVSVIIPVYNAGEFVRKAVESAVPLDEVEEIILVEDGSADLSLMVCHQLVNEYANVRLFQHEGGLNQGAARSRNLGIEKSESGFIAFLDADDWYLPHRFKKDAAVFQKYPNADAVYSCSISENHQDDFTRRYGATSDIRLKIGNDASTMDFYKNIIQQETVLFDTNSITIKKDFLLKDKLFDDRLELHQDTELWKRLMRRGHFYAGEIEIPIAVIRSHQGNRITSRTIQTKTKMHFTFLNNIGVENLYPLEKWPMYQATIRLLSRQINQRLPRIFYYYFTMLSNCFRQKAFLMRLTTEYCAK